MNIGSLATRDLQLSKGRQWCISQVVLCEMFMTKNVKRRDQLIDFSRCLFSRDLISSPEELMVNYIEKQCPSQEIPYNIESHSLFSQEWKNACDNMDFWFEPDIAELSRRIKNLQDVSRWIVNAFKNLESKGIEIRQTNICDLTPSFISYINDKVYKIYNSSDGEFINFVQVSLSITTSLLCYGIGLDNLTVENYWNSKGLTEPLQRLEHIVDNIPQILTRGPIANMARMYLVQAHCKSRGLHLDSLHSIYITYTDLFFSCDDHFLSMINKSMDDINYIKIKDAKDMQFRTPE